MHRHAGMHQKTWELQERTRNFVRSVERLSASVPNEASAVRLARKLVVAATAVDRGYRDVSASRSPEDFIKGMSAVARQAKVALANLQMLLQLNHITIEATRDLIFEARGLRAIFVASCKTARKRQRERALGMRAPRRAETTVGRRARPGAANCGAAATGGSSRAACRR